MSELRLLDYNYFFEDDSDVSASSSDSSYPVSNLTNYSRSKVWRSSGNFVIASTNAKINFKESSGGAELTATLTSGTYTPTTLAAEIVTQLEAAGGAEYTCTYSTSTGKWTISSDGSFLSLLWASGTDTANQAGSTIGFDSSTDSLGATTYTGAFIALHTEEWVLLDVNTTEEIDSFAIMFDPAVLPKFTSEAVLTIEANATDEWSAAAVSVAITVDDTYGVGTYFWSSAQSYRFWRFKIVDKKNPYLYVEVPKLILTKATQLTQLPQIGFSFQKKDRSAAYGNNYGNMWFDLYPNLRMMGLSFNHLSEADIATLESIYDRLGNSFPLAISLDSTATLWDKDRFFVYGRMTNAFDTKQTFLSYFDASIVIEEIV